MEAEIFSPFEKGSRGIRTAREFRLWYKHQWVLGTYYVYRCETTDREFRDAQLNAMNKAIAEEILKDRCKV